MPNILFEKLDEYDYDYGNKIPSLSKKDRDKLNALCPFYVSDDMVGIIKIVQVSKKSFIPEFGGHIRADMSTKRYSGINDLDEEGKRIYANVVNKFFEAHNNSIQLYGKFRDDNPEYFV